MTYSYTMSFADEASMTENANIVKDVLLQQLEADGLIESAAEIASKYAVVLYKKGRFGQLWDKMRGAPDNDKLRYMVVKSPYGEKVKGKK